MTDANWPNPKRPGVPMFPERDGWHWLSFDSDEETMPFEWSHEDYCDAETQWGWVYDGCQTDAYEMSRRFRYIGPCLTPTQIAELLAGERERCAKACDAIATFASSDWKATAYDSDNRASDAAEETAEICAQKIRNLGAAS